MARPNTGRTPLRPLPDGSRYQLLLRIASGGMATVYLGRLKASAGFWKLRAIKRAHTHLLEDLELRRHMIREARLCARIEHPNVVAMQDVEELDGELLLIMDYVEGTSVVDFMRHYADYAQAVPPTAAIRLVLDAAAGLSAAHQLKDEEGQPLGLVHRDVSPQNLLVGRDGVTKVADFGIAKCMQAAGDIQTNSGGLKGKVGYMSPEYVRGSGLDARSDIFALGVVLWELLSGRRLFRGSNELVTLQQVVSMAAPPIAQLAPRVGPRVEAVLARALHKSPARRFETSSSFAQALEQAAAAEHLLGVHAEVAQLLDHLFGARLKRRGVLIKKAVAEHDAHNAKSNEPSPDSARTAVMPISPQRRQVEPANSDEHTLTLPPPPDSSISANLLAPARYSLPESQRSSGTRWSSFILLLMVSVGLLLFGWFGIRSYDSHPSAAAADLPSATIQSAPAAAIDPTASAFEVSQPSAASAAPETTAITAAPTLSALPNLKPTRAQPAPARPPPRPYKPRPKPSPRRPDPNPYR